MDVYVAREDPEPGVNGRLVASHVPLADVDWLIPHQANVRILQATAKKLGLPMERLVVTVDRHANTSAASVPLALDRMMAEGDARSGDTALLIAFGAGLSYAAQVVTVP